jgi:hypothetical protein
VPARVRAAYAYEDAAEHTFEAAHRRDMACIYEMPIAHWQTVQRLLHEEAQRLPAWRQTIQGLDDSPAKLERKVREIELADTIIVPSRFVLDSLPGPVRAAKRCVLAPFGAPSPNARAGESGRQGGGPLRVIFAGAMTQRKGLGDLFAAMRLLNRPDVELVVLGALNAPLSFYRSQYPGFVYEGTRPHADVLRIMRSCDVFVLPALVEGGRSCSSRRWPAASRSSSRRIPAATIWSRKGAPASPSPSDRPKPSPNGSPGSPITATRSPRCGATRSGRRPRPAGCTTRTGCSMRSRASFDLPRARGSLMTSRPIRHAALSLFSPSKRAALRRSTTRPRCRPRGPHRRTSDNVGWLLTIEGGPSIAIPAECYARHTTALCHA